jgi:adenine C2-methylase RlmN of 23S rRNA A2503 and tRNA A37
MFDFTVEAIALHKMVVGLAGRVDGGLDILAACGQLSGAATTG